MKLLKLEQPDCRGCVEVGNILNNSEVEYEAIDVVENPEVADRYGVMGLPLTLLVDDKGKTLQRAVGVDRPAIVEMIEKIKGA
ncbi:thioredoxin 1 [Terribacillus aidingensis]|uniref:Thioredoxin 1 n=1 Tax=Terribacillus aidingensis TaxID=586416 RepID=A0A285NM84_9BACI|nr:thioredoxin family protein [Terribacillus aidingensis]SNZ10033.1 thioredoxin 1 [Terribacillus aidingensis]